MALQTEDNAEIQGVVSKKIPGYSVSQSSQLDSYVLLLGADRGHKAIWELIYYNSASVNGGKPVEIIDENGNTITYLGKDAFAALAAYNIKLLKNQAGGAS